MALRLTGLMSGIDTESVIQELVAVKQTKVDDAKKAQTKLEWKQEIWKELNTKLKSLQTKYLNNMRFSDAYSKLTTKVSNESVVSVLTGESAMSSVQELQVNQLAKTAYLTGGVVKSGTADSGAVTALTKISDLEGFSGEGTITLTANGKTVDIEITQDTTISDFLNKVKGAGLNASFDAANQRFFINAKESGADSDFSLTASDAAGNAALSALGLQVGLEDAVTKAEYEKYAAYYVEGDRTATIANMQSLIDAEVASKVSSYLEQYKSLSASYETAKSKVEEIEEKYKDSPLESVETYTEQLKEKNDAIKQKEEELAQLKENETDNEEAIAKAEEELAVLKKEAEEITAKKTDAETLAAQKSAMTEIEEQQEDIKQYVNITESKDAEGNVTYEAEATDKLKTQVEDAYVSKAAYADAVIKDPSLLGDSGATKVAGQDAIITLNGATFTGNDNVFEINGLTITALATTAADETVTITTQEDVDGIYDMVKDFITEYNTIINEMDKLYNADSASGYEPLTDEEKEALSESEIEKYEQKIKDALLRRDSNLSSVSSALKSIMSSGIEVNGKMMYLSDFGIETQGYFEAAENEKNAYHIAGNPDDDVSSSDADVLKGMISTDPDTVISFFTELSRQLYSKMDSLSRSVDGYRTYGNFYDDKKMESDYSDYTTKIAELEEKLAEYEDKWYAKFAAMETAMANLQSNASAVTSLLGG